MASNRFGNIFTFVTWGESHGEALGVVIDGCPAQIPLSSEIIDQELLLRKPALTPYTSARGEKDTPHILSGVFEGKTTGAPISILFYNENVDSSAYTSLKEIYRPGHANFSYLGKYGIFDYRGGGRASARETVCRVAAGAVAKQLLRYYHIEVCAYIQQIGPLKAQILSQSILELKSKRFQSPIFCPDLLVSKEMESLLLETKEKGDSLGGIVSLQTSKLPIGLGDPIYEKLEAMMAKAMLSIPATKGIEFGLGFKAAETSGSESLDLFTLDNEGQIETMTNHSGGILGGISNGMPLTLNVAFKPTSSIAQDLPSVSLQGDKITFSQPPHARHDPCVAIRGVAVVEAMAALTLADAILMRRSSSISYSESLIGSTID